MQVLQGNIGDLTPVVADAHVVAYTELAGKGHDHAVDHVGDIVLGEQCQTGKNDGQGGEKLARLDLEQGKETLRMDKVNQVLKLFGYELGPVAWERNEIVERTAAKDASEGAVIRKVRKG